MKKNFLILLIAVVILVSIAGISLALAAGKATVIFSGPDVIKPGKTYTYNYTLTVENACAANANISVGGAFEKVSGGENLFYDSIPQNSNGSVSGSVTVRVKSDALPGDEGIISVIEDESTCSELVFDDSGNVVGDPIITTVTGSISIPVTVEVLTVSGIGNKTITAGSSFDPLQGVQANNVYTGDVTDKIQVEGQVDTGVVGVYLLKYTINDTITVRETELPVSYTGYRWIGVTEAMPEKPGTIALTKNNLAVDTAGSNVSIKKNGSSIAFSSLLTDPGEYTLTVNGSSVTAVIDRTGPSLSSSWAKSGKSIKITVQASDVAGVAQLKYKAGKCSLTDVKNGGTAFSGSFTVSSTGVYTLYAKDKLGNESVKVIMASSSNADYTYLSSVGISAGTLSRAFTPKVYSYKITLGEHQSSVTLTPVKEWDGASMTIDGKAVSSKTVSVNNGKTVKVKVKVTYSKSSRTYTFSITRAKSTNNNLAALTATAGQLTPAFSSGVTSYTLLLDENTKSTTIKATVQNSLAKVSPSSKKVSLNNGQSKTYKFTVKAQSGAKKTYTVTVTRAKSTITALKYLKTNSSKYPLTPVFNAGVTNYTVTLPENQSSVTISAKPVSSLTKVTVDGRKNSKSFKLANGQSIAVKVVVTAQSGATKTYTVTVTRAKSTSTALKYIKTNSSKFPLKPKFKTGTTNYTVTLPANQSSVTISAQASNSLTKATVDGRESSKTFELANGQSITVKVVATAQSGAKKEYTITVNRL